MVKMPAMQKTRVQFLGQEDPLEEGMATHSSILALDRGAWGATGHGIEKKSNVTERLTPSLYF